MEKKKECACNKNCKCEKKRIKKRPRIKYIKAVMKMKDYIIGFIILLFSVQLSGQVYWDEIEPADTTGVILISKGVDNLFDTVSLASYVRDSLFNGVDSIRYTPTEQYVYYWQDATKDSIKIVNGMDIDFGYFGGSWSVSIYDQAGQVLDNAIMPGVINYFAVDATGGGVTTTITTSAPSAKARPAQQHYRPTTGPEYATPET